MLLAEYKHTMFIARKGSWNRTRNFAYDVINVSPSADGRSCTVKMK